MSNCSFLAVPLAFLQFRLDSVFMELTVKLYLGDRKSHVAFMQTVLKSKSARLSTERNRHYRYTNVIELYSMFLTVGKWWIDAPNYILLLGVMKSGCLTVWLRRTFTVVLTLCDRAVCNVVVADDGWVNERVEG